ncbi:MAG: N-6 DNA methylase, partial [Deltaproteobacteria bacterium]|nr:N-6 DNA methylase [Deltaproteobacteria bacterium]
MQPVDIALRAQLARTIKEARQIAEDAAHMVLENLGVGEPLPFPHLNEKELELRHRLRIHGRQLGDIQDTTSGVQKIGILLEEVAYEHWHRMLFARFLAENNLLMYPDPETPVAITLEECEELASKEEAKNGFELAARFATKMLPQIFQVDSPVFELNLPPENSQKLERLLKDLPTDIFKASDSLGWVYQFWQSAKKDEVRNSEVKIGHLELPAVTQAFTEPYMVNFLLDNSLGAWWAERRLTAADIKSATNEEELRQKVALPGMPLEYLRFAKNVNESFEPAAGFFQAWPKKICDLKILDPCCGSGHFLVAAFLMLVPLRRELEGLSVRDAADAVLKENLFGLELDRRCVELAAFALALTAWKYEGAGGYRPLPELNLACSGLSAGIPMSLSLEEGKKLALEYQNLISPLQQNLAQDIQKNLSFTLNAMFQTFKDAPILGSLLNPAQNPETILIPWEQLRVILEKTFWQEQNEERKEARVVAQGLAKAASLLSGKYHLVITNVPYLSHRKETLRLREYCKNNYPEAHHDLATVFLERCLEFCDPRGTANIVMPQNLLFLTTFKKLREKLLKENQWHLFARLGPQAFESGAGGNINIMLISMSRGHPCNLEGNMFNEKNIK